MKTGKIKLLKLHAVFSIIERENDIQKKVQTVSDAQWWIKKVGDAECEA